MRWWRDARRRAAEKLEETLVEIPCECFPFSCREVGCE